MEKRDRELTAKQKEVKMSVSLTIWRRDFTGKHYRELEG